MKAKNVREVLQEWGAGGGGYAAWGGGWGRNFGNPSMGGRFYGRGFGFGSGNNSGGPNMMYTYDIKPLNRSLEPPASDVMDDPIIHVGSVIKGKLLGKDRHIIGQVIQVVEDHDNNVKYYEVIDPDTGMKVRIDPTTSFIWEPEPEGIDPVGVEIDMGKAGGKGKDKSEGNANESLYEYDDLLDVEDEEDKEKTPKNKRRFLTK